MNTAPALQKLLDELERLPGIGAKSAQRIAYWMMNTDSATVLRLAEAITEVKSTVHFCSRCFNYAEDDLCEVCRSAQRDTTAICVVAEPRDIAAIERTGVYTGLYHVLGGELAPWTASVPTSCTSPSSCVGWLPKTFTRSYWPQTRTWKARPRLLTSPAW